MALNPNGRLSDRFRIIRRIGGGGVGVIYEAYDEQSRRTVAIKELLPEHAGATSARARFLFGSNAVARLNLLTAVTIYDSVSGPDTAYLVLEFMPGGSLADLLRQEKRLPSERAVEIAIAVCHTLESAHALNVTHRNLKPQNILFTESGSLKVADFGMADVPQTAFEPLSPLLPMNETVLATLRYASPEQCEQRKVDHRADLYSLGVILYEMLTGAPYLDFSRCASLEHAKEAVVTARPRPPGQLNAEVPRWLESVILKALAKDPEHRFQDASEMQAALLAGEEVAMSAHERTAASPHRKAKDLAARTRHTRVRDRRWRVLWDTLIGALVGASGGLLLSVIAYSLRAMLVGTARTLQEGAVSAVITGVVVAAIVGAVLGWISSE